MQGELDRTSKDERGAGRDQQRQRTGPTLGGTREALTLWGALVALTLGGALESWTEPAGALEGTGEEPAQVEQWASDIATVGGSVPCSRVSPQSWTLPARAGIRTHNLGLPRVSSPTLYPLGHDCPA